MAAQLKPGQGPLDYGSRTWLKLLFAAIFFVLYAPIVTLIAFSFNTDKRGVVWRGYVSVLCGRWRCWRRCWRALWGCFGVWLAVQLAQRLICADAFANAIDIKSVILPQ